MDFILSHWHCILPLAALVVGLFFLREKRPEKKNNKGRHGAARQPSSPSSVIEQEISM